VVEREGNAGGRHCRPPSSRGANARDSRTPAPRGEGANPTLAWEFRPSNRELAVWEVASSSWLRQVLPPSYSIPIHHYVITDEDAVYEVAAQHWHTEPLPNG
jgi:hypothetical protein